MRKGDKRLQDIATKKEANSIQEISYSGGSVYRKTQTLGRLVYNRRRLNKTEVYIV